MMQWHLSNVRVLKAVRRRCNECLGLDILELLHKCELIIMAMQRAAEAQSDAQVRPTQYTEERHVVA